MTGAELSGAPRDLVDLATYNGWTINTRRLDIDGCTEAVALSFSTLFADGYGWGFFIAFGRNEDTGRWAMLEDDEGDRLTGVLIRPDGTEHTRRWRQAPLDSLRYHLTHVDEWVDTIVESQWFTERKNRP